MYLVNRYDYERDLDLTIVSDEATELVVSVDCPTWSDVLSVLAVTGDVAPGAYDMAPWRVISQVNHGNGGELLILCAGSGALAAWACPVCEHKAPVGAGRFVDHAPGASDPYS